jgi:hypothetical protein
MLSKRQNKRSAIRTIDDLAEENGEASFMRHVEYLLKKKNDLERIVMVRSGHKGLRECRMAVWMAGRTEI